MSKIELDRLAELRVGGPERLARFLRAVPAAAEVVAGRGPAAHYDAYGRPKQSGPAVDLATVAELIARPSSIELAILSCDRLAFQVLATVAWLGGTATPEQICGLAAGLDRDDLDDAVDRLDDRLLAGRGDQGVITARPGIRDHVRPPGVSVRETAYWMAHHDLGRAVSALGAKPAVRKDERIDQLVHLLSDRPRIEAVVARLGPPVRRLFELIRSTGSLPTRELEPGFNEWTAHKNVSPLSVLLSTGLVGTDRDYRWCHVYREVAVTLNGGLFSDWRRLAEPRPVPLSGASSGASRGARTLVELMRLWSAEAPIALKTGGLGVTVVRAAAKRLGVAPGDVGLLAVLAHELGLLDPKVTERRGRGRNQTIEVRWMPTEKWAGFAALDPDTRTRLLVQAWFDSRLLLAGATLPERFEPHEYGAHGVSARAGYLAVLSDFPVDTGVDGDELAGVVADLVLAAERPDVGGMIAASRLLGLAPATGPVGLTAGGRALVTGRRTAAVAAVRTFVVQADHTVVAPLDLDAEVDETLLEIAEVESVGGVRVLRITDARLARALDHGHSGSDIVRFLQEHSSVPVPKNVVRTVHDVAARHGVLRVGSGVSWLISDDPVALASAVKVKAARLFQLNATTAVSSLTEPELVAVLRGKGLAPVSDAETVTRLVADTRQASPPVELRDHLLGTDAELAELAARLHAAPPRPRPEPRSRGPEFDPTARHVSIDPLDLIALVEGLFDDD